MALTFTLEETFNATPDAVFAAMTDVDGYENWMPNCLGIERLTDGDTSVGTKWRETRKMYGKEAIEEFEVTALDPARRLELFVDGTKGSSGKGEYRFQYDFVSAGEEGTRVLVTGEIGGIGPFASLVGRLFLGSFKRAVQQDHDALRRYVEDAE